MVRSMSGYTGELPPARLNMARYCVGDSAAVVPDRTALVVVSDAAAPAEHAERCTYAGLDDAVRAVAAGLLESGGGVAACSGSRFVPGCVAVGGWRG